MVSNSMEWHYIAEYGIYRVTQNYYIVLVISTIMCHSESKIKQDTSLTHCFNIAYFGPPHGID